MKLNYLLLLIFTVTFVKAQNRNTIWCFGDSAGIDFRTIANPLPFNSVMDGRGSCASISDSTGNLLFYAETYVSLAKTIVWNRNNDTLLNGGDSLTGDGVYNELQIISYPGSDHKFILFHLGAHTYVDGIFYSVIDMNLDQSRGAVTNEKNIRITNSRVGDCLQAIKHANGRDWWLITKQSSSPLTRNNRFIVYLITPFGISSPESYDFNDALDMDFQKIILNPVGEKIMLLNLRGFMCEYDFDRCTGIINNPNVIYPEATSPPYDRLYWDGSYSQDGRFFYATTNRWSGLNEIFIIQYDLFAASISDSSDTLDITLPPIGPGSIRLAPDGKIYCSRAYESPGVNSFPYADTMYNYINMNLSVINEPNQLGAACNFQPFSFYLGGKRTYYGLPSNPNYQLGPIIGSVCDSLFNSIDDRSVEDIRVEVYPNPFSKSITIHLVSASNVELKMYNNLGSVLLTRKFRDNIQIDLSFLSSGTYQLELISEKNVVVKKIVKTE